MLDFFLPLWAGAGLGAGPAQVGLLTAVETLTSFVVRPIAGVLADRFDRGRVAAVGALLYAPSFAGWVLADSLALAYPSAFLGGAGGALFWVALRARVGEGLRDDSSAYAKLFAAEGNGTWIAFVAAMSLVSSIDYQGVYAVAGVACLLAGVLLLLPDGMPPAERGQLPGLREVGRKMRPLLALVVVTATAETGVALLLLLHLQRGHQLELGEIAAVFLPGFIVYSVLPEYLHRFVVKLGRTRVLGIAMVASAAFAVALSFAPNPYVIAGLWILSAAAVLLLAALLVRFAVRAVGVPDHPRAPPAAETVEAEPVVEDEPEPVDEEEEDSAWERRTVIKRWLEHAGLFAVAQVALAFFGESWPADLVTNGIPAGVEWWNWVFGNARDSTTWLMNASRIWCFVLLIDTLWTWGSVLVRRRRG